MRSTAIVNVTREPCPDPGCGGVGTDRPHARYRATCRDCGLVMVEHLRVILDAPGTGLAQQHRRTCTKVPR